MRDVVRTSSQTQTIATAQAQLRWRDSLAIWPHTIVEALETQHTDGRPMMSKKVGETARNNDQ